MKVHLDNIAVCDDCIQAIVNDDFTGLDYHYDPDEADQRYHEITKGITRLSTFGNIVATGEEDEFSHRLCDCCESKLSGRRHFCHTLIEEA